MRRAVVQSPTSRADVADLYNFFEARNPASAERFLAAVQRTFDLLASLPGEGTRLDPEDPALADLRVCTVDRFRSYLVFYRARGDRIEVLRVLHGARGDLAGLLGPEIDPA